MLKVTLHRSAVRCTVELDGVDISRHLVGLEVRADVGELTVATLTYSGAIVIDGDEGQLRLEQASHFVQCTDCRKVLAGEPRVAVIRMTALRDGTDGHAGVQS